jgi:hypothetical protein
VSATVAVNGTRRETVSRMRLVLRWAPQPTVVLHTTSRLSTAWWCGGVVVWWRGGVVVWCGGVMATLSSHVKTASS